MRNAFSRYLDSEGLRVLFLAIAAIWAASPLLNRAEVGGGDAVWYHYQVADAVTQFRAGIFPVFTGQTEYAFNGAIHPLRTAPYCQYLAGLIDLVTGHRLGFVLLLHLTAVVSLVAGAVIAYAALVWIAPQRRWRAVCLAIVYIFTPGVLGLPFAQDLYMSTMAIPWVPLAFAGAIQMYRRQDYMTPIILGGSLGALWWAHPPIAVWTTFTVFLLLVFSFFLAAEKARWVRRVVFVAIPFCLIGAYPVVSVLSLRSTDEKIVPLVHDRQELLNEVQGASPALLLPVDLERPLLTFMQPGYIALAALILAGFSSFFIERERRWPVHLLVGCALIYLAMILPVPGITAWIWRHVPDLVANMTSIWPMQRLALIIAGIAVISLQASLRNDGQAGERERKLAQLFGTVALVWITWQADGVRTLAHHRTLSLDETELTDAQENVNVSAYCYQQLPQRPAYFIHGATDPAMEIRLLDFKTNQVIQSNRSAVESASTEPWIPMGVKQTDNPALFELAPNVTLQPGVRYLLTFDFSGENLHGVLRFTGASMRRVYALPSAGDAKGFGTGPLQEKSIAIWTSQRGKPETIRMEFIDQGAEGIAPLSSFAKVRLSPIQPEKLPVEVVSLLPLAMKVRWPESALLETMRMYIPGWSATVNGTPVKIERSKEGLVAIDVPAGENRVALRYKGPLILRIAFWSSLSAVALTLIGGILFLASRLLFSFNLSTPATEHS